MNVFSLVHKVVVSSEVQSTSDTVSITSGSRFFFLTGLSRSSSFFFLFLLDSCIILGF